MQAPIGNTTGYVNYVYNLQAKGTAQVTSQIMGMSGLVGSTLGQLAFQTSAYLSDAESVAMSFGMVATAGLYKATKQAMEFDYAMQGVQAIAGQNNIGNLGEQAMAMSNKFGVAVDQMVAGLESLARAGVSPSNMQGILEQAMGLSKLENLDLNTAVNSLISTTNLLDTQNLDLESPEYVEALKHQNQKITATSEAAPINAQDIMHTLEHVGGYAQSTNLDQDDLYAVIAQLGAKGTKSEIAGTSLRAFLAAGQKDTAQRALERIGLKVSDLWKNDDTIMSISDMKDVLDQAMEAKGYTKQEKLEFYSDFAGYKQANQIMKIDTKSVREFKDKIDRSWDVGKKIETILGTSQANLQSILQTGINLVTSVGQPLMKMANVILAPVKMIMSAIDFAVNKIPGVKWVAAGTLLMVALRGMATVFNRVVPAVGSMLHDFGTMNDYVLSTRNLLADSVEIIRHLPSGVDRHTGEPNRKWLIKKDIDNQLSHITMDDYLRYYKKYEGYDGKGLSQKDIYDEIRNFNKGKDPKERSKMEDIIRQAKRDRYENTGQKTTENQKNTQEIAQERNDILNQLVIELEGVKKGLKKLPKDNQEEKKANSPGPSEISQINTTLSDMDTHFTTEMHLNTTTLHADLEGLRNTFNYIGTTVDSIESKISDVITVTTNLYSYVSTMKTHVYTVRFKDDSVFNIDTSFLDNIDKTLQQGFEKVIDAIERKKEERKPYSRKRENINNQQDTSNQQNVKNVQIVTESTTEQIPSRINLNQEYSNRQKNAIYFDRSEPREDSLMKQRRNIRKDNKGRTRKMSNEEYRRRRKKLDQEIADEIASMEKFAKKMEEDNYQDERNFKIYMDIRERVFGRVKNINYSTTDKYGNSVKHKINFIDKKIQKKFGNRVIATQPPLYNQFQRGQIDQKTLRAAMQEVKNINDKIITRINNNQSYQHLINEREKKISKIFRPNQIDYVGGAGNGWDIDRKIFGIMEKKFLGSLPKEDAERILQARGGVKVDLTRSRSDASKRRIKELKLNEKGKYDDFNRQMEYDQYVEEMAEQYGVGSDTYRLPKYRSGWRLNEIHQLLPNERNLYLGHIVQWLKDVQKDVELQQDFFSNREEYQEFVATQYKEALRYLNAGDMTRLFTASNVNTSAFEKIFIEMNDVINKSKKYAQVDARQMIKMLKDNAKIITTGTAEHKFYKKEGDQKKKLKDNVIDVKGEVLGEFDESEYNRESTYERTLNQDKHRPAMIGLQYDNVANSLPNIEYHNEETGVVSVTQAKDLTPDQAVLMIDENADGVYRSTMERNANKLTELQSLNPATPVPLNHKDQLKTREEIGKEIDHQVHLMDLITTQYANIIETAKKERPVTDEDYIKKGINALVELPQGIIKDIDAKVKREGKIKDLTFINSNAEEETLSPLLIWRDKNGAKGIDDVRAQFRNLLDNHEEYLQFVLETYSGFAHDPIVNQILEIAEMYGANGDQYVLDFIRDDKDFNNPAFLAGDLKSTLFKLYRADKLDSTDQDSLLGKLRENRDDFKLRYASDLYKWGRFDQRYEEDFITDFHLIKDSGNYSDEEDPFDKEDKPVDFENLPLQDKLDWASRVIGAYSANEIMVKDDADTKWYFDKQSGFLTEALRAMQNKTKANIEELQQQYDNAVNVIIEKVAKLLRQDKFVVEIEKALEKGYIDVNSIVYDGEGNFNIVDTNLFNELKFFGPEYISTPPNKKYIPKAGAKEGKGQKFGDIDDPEETIQAAYGVQAALNNRTYMIKGAKDRKIPDVNEEKENKSKIINRSLENVYNLSFRPDLIKGVKAQPGAGGKEERFHEQLIVTKDAVVSDRVEEKNRIDFEGAGKTAGNGKKFIPALQKGSDIIPGLFTYATKKGRDAFERDKFGNITGILQDENGRFSDIWTTELEKKRNSEKLRNRLIENAGRLALYGFSQHDIHEKIKLPENMKKAIEAEYKSQEFVDTENTTLDLDEAYQRMKVMEYNNKNGDRVNLFKKRVDQKEYNALKEANMLLKQDIENPTIKSGEYEIFDLSLLQYNQEDLEDAAKMRLLTKSLLLEQNAARTGDSERNKNRQNQSLNLIDIQNNQGTDFIRNIMDLGSNTRFAKGLWDEIKDVENKDRFMANMLDNPELFNAMQGYSTARMATLIREKAEFDSLEQRYDELTTKEKEKHHELSKVNYDAIIGIEQNIQNILEEINTIAFIREQYENEENELGFYDLGAFVRAEFVNNAQTISAKTTAKNQSDIDLAEKNKFIVDNIWGGFNKIFDVISLNPMSKPHGRSLFSRKNIDKTLSSPEELKNFILTEKLYKSRQKYEENGGENTVQKYLYDNNNRIRPLIYSIMRKKAHKNTTNANVKKQVEKFMQENNEWEQLFYIYEELQKEQKLFDDKGIVPPWIQELIDAEEAKQKEIEAKQKAIDNQNNSAKIGNNVKTASEFDPYASFDSTIFMMWDNPYFIEQTQKMAQKSEYDLLKNKKIPELEQNMFRAKKAFIKAKHDNVPQQVLQDLGNQWSEANEEYDDAMAQLYYLEKELGKEPSLKDSIPENLTGPEKKEKELTQLKIKIQDAFDVFRIMGNPINEGGIRVATSNKKGKPKPLKQIIKERSEAISGFQKFSFLGENYEESYEQLHTNAIKEREKIINQYFSKTMDDYHKTAIQNIMDIDPDLREDNRELFDHRVSTQERTLFMNDVLKGLNEFKRIAPFLPKDLLENFHAEHDIFEYIPKEIRKAFLTEAAKSMYNQSLHHKNMNRTPKYDDTKVSDSYSGDYADEIIDEDIYDNLEDEIANEIYNTHQNQQTQNNIYTGQRKTHMNQQYNKNVGRKSRKHQKDKKFGGRRRQSKNDFGDHVGSVSTDDNSKDDFKLETEQDEIVYNYVQKIKEQINNTLIKATKTIFGEYDGEQFKQSLLFNSIGYDTNAKSLNNASAALKKNIGSLEQWHSALEHVSTVFAPLTIVALGFAQIINGLKIVDSIGDALLSVVGHANDLQTKGFTTINNKKYTQDTYMGQMIGSIGGAIGPLSEKIKNFGIEYILPNIPIITGLSVALLGLQQALNWSYKSHEKYLKQLEEDQKEHRSRSKALKVATEQSKKSNDEYKYILNRTKLDNANLTRITGAIKLTNERNDTLWGQYGVTAALDKMQGKYESTAEEYDGTSGQIRRIKEHTTGGQSLFRGLPGYFSPAEEMAAAYYDANKLAIGIMDEYKDELGELYDAETNAMRKNPDNPRETREFQIALDKFVEATGITKEHAQQYLDYMQTEHNVDNAVQTMQAHADTIMAQTDMQIQAISFGGNPADVLGLNGIEAQQNAMVQAQADMIQLETSSQLWWKAVWSTITSPVRAIIAPIFAIANILGAIWSAVTGNWNAAGMHLQQAGANLNVLGETATYWGAWGNVEATNFNAIGQGAIDEQDRANYGNATTASGTGGPRVPAAQDNSIFGFLPVWWPNKPGSGGAHGTKDHKETLAKNAQETFFGKLIGGVTATLGTIVSILTLALIGKGIKIFWNSDVGQRLVGGIADRLPLLKDKLTNFVDNHQNVKKVLGYGQTVGKILGFEKLSDFIGQYIPQDYKDMWHDLWNKKTEEDITAEEVEEDKPIEENVSSISENVQNIWTWIQNIFQNDFGTSIINYFKNNNASQSSNLSNLLQLPINTVSSDANKSAMKNIAYTDGVMSDITFVSDHLINKINEENDMQKAIGIYFHELAHNGLEHGNPLIRASTFYNDKNQPWDRKVAEYEAEYVSQKVQEKLGLEVSGSGNLDKMKANLIADGRYDEVDEAKMNATIDFMVQNGTGFLNNLANYFKSNKDVYNQDIYKYIKKQISLSKINSDRTIFGYQNDNIENKLIETLSTFKDTSGESDNRIQYEVLNHANNPMWNGPLGAPGISWQQGLDHESKMINGFLAYYEFTHNGAFSNHIFDKKSTIEESDIYKTYYNSETGEQESVTYGDMTNALIYALNHSKGLWTNSILYHGGGPLREDENSNLGSIHKIMSSSFTDETGEEFEHRHPNGLVTKIYAPMGVPGLYTNTMTEDEFTLDEGQRFATLSRDEKNRPTEVLLLTPQLMSQLGVTEEILDQAIAQGFDVKTYIAQKQILESISAPNQSILNPNISSNDNINVISSPIQFQVPQISTDDVMPQDAKTLPVASLMPAYTPTSWKEYIPEKIHQYTDPWKNYLKEQPFKIQKSLVLGLSTPEQREEFNKKKRSSMNEEDREYLNEKYNLGLDLDGDTYKTAKQKNKAVRNALDESGQWDEAADDLYVREKGDMFGLLKGNYGTPWKEYMKSQMENIMTEAEIYNQNPTYMGKEIYDRENASWAVKMMAKGMELKDNWMNEIGLGDIGTVGELRGAIKDPKLMEQYIKDRLDSFDSDSTIGQYRDKIYKAQELAQDPEKAMEWVQSKYYDGLDKGEEEYEWYQGGALGYEQLSIPNKIRHMKESVLGMDAKESFTELLQDPERTMEVAMRGYNALQEGGLNGLLGADEDYDITGSVKEKVSELFGQIKEGAEEGIDDEDGEDGGSGGLISKAKEKLAGFFNRKQKSEESKGDQKECPVCGTMNDADSTYCMECGHDLSKPAPPDYNLTPEKGKQIIDDLTVSSVTKKEAKENDAGDSLGYTYGMGDVNLVPDNLQSVWQPGDAGENIMLTGLHETAHNLLGHTSSERYNTMSKDKDKGWMHKISEVEAEMAAVGAADGLGINVPKWMRKRLDKQKENVISENPHGINYELVEQAKNAMVTNSDVLLPKITGSVEGSGLFKDKNVKKVKDIQEQSINHRKTVYGEHNNIGKTMLKNEAPMSSTVAMPSMSTGGIVGDNNDDMLGDMGDLVTSDNIKKGGKGLSKIGSKLSGKGGKLGKIGKGMSKIGGGLSKAGSKGVGKAGGKVMSNAGGKVASKVGGKAGGKIASKVGGKIASKVGGKIASKVGAQVASKVLGGALMATGIGAPLGLLLESPIGGMLMEGVFNLGGQALGAVGGAIGGVGKALGFGRSAIGGGGGLLGAAGGALGGIAGAAGGLLGSVFGGGGPGNMGKVGSSVLQKIGTPLGGVVGMLGNMFSNDKQTKSLNEKMEAHAGKTLEAVREQNNKTASTTNSSGGNITIQNININTADDPEAIKAMFLELLVELQEQVSPRLVSRTAGKPPANSTTSDNPTSSTTDSNNTDPNNTTNTNGTDTNNTNTNTNGTDTNSTNK